MRKVIVLIILSLISTASATEWQSICSITVFNHDNITCNGYNITNIQFSSPVKSHSFNGKLILDTVIPAITFRLQKNNKNIETIYLDTTTQTYTNDNEPIRISLSEITSKESFLWDYEQYNPKASLSISFVKLPLIQIKITPEYPEYEYGKTTQIKTIIEIWNSGDMPAADINLDYNFSGLETHTPLTKRINIISKNERITYDYFLEMPLNNTDQKYNFKVIASLKNEIGTTTQTFTYTAENNISIKPARHNLIFTKYMNDRLYVGDNTTIVITASNSGLYDVFGIVVDDYTPDYFRVYNKTKFTIPFLRPGTQYTISYIVTPGKAGTYKIPSANINYSINGQDYTNKTNEVTVTIIETGKIVITPTPTLTEIITPVITTSSTPPPQMPSNILTEPGQSNKPSIQFFILMLFMLIVGFIILVNR